MRSLRIIMLMFGGCLTIASNASAQLPAIREGNKYYREGNFEEALIELSFNLKSISDHFLLDCLTRDELSKMKKR